MPVLCSLKAPVHAGGSNRLILGGSGNPYQNTKMLILGQGVENLA